MPDENDKQLQQPEEDDSQKPAYAGDDIPGDELQVPQDVPQAQIAHAAMTGGAVEKAPKKTIIKRLILLIIAVAVLAAVGVVAWKLVPAKDEPRQPAQTSQDQTKPAQTTDPVAAALADTQLSQTYTSDLLRLSLKYPSGWKVSEDNNAVTVKSPSFDIADNSGIENTTYFKIYIKLGATDDEGKYLGKGYAVAPSETINYSDPEVGQRKTTFLTDFGLDNTDNFAYLVVQGNFELEKGDTLGPKFASEPDSFLVSAGFATAEDTGGLQTTLMPIDSYKDNLAYKTGVEIIKSLRLK